MDEIRVCVVKFGAKAKKAYMFEYGEGIYLKEGDTVIVLNADGEETEAIVVDTVTFNLRYESDKEELNRLLMVAGVEMPFRRVVGTVKRTYYNWEEDADGEES